MSKCRSRFLFRLRLQLYYQLLEIVALLERCQVGVLPERLRILETAACLSASMAASAYCLRSPSAAFGMSSAQSVAT
jgi:hypothetical protein